MAHVMAYPVFWNRCVALALSFSSLFGAVHYTGRRDAPRQSTVNASIVQRRLLRSPIRQAICVLAVGDTQSGEVRTISELPAVAEWAPTSDSIYISPDWGYSARAAHVDGLVHAPAQ